MTTLAHFLAESSDLITPTTMLAGLATFTGGVIIFILRDMKASIDRNTAMVATMVEVQIARMTQSANPDERKEVVEMLRKHAEESKK